MNKPLLSQIEETWAHHPNIGIGELLSKAASITRGELRLNPAYVSDDEILSGLKALIPSEWEQLT